MKKIILSTVIALVGVGLGAPMIMDAPTASSDIILARRGADDAAGDDRRGRRGRGRGADDGVGHTEMMTVEPIILARRGADDAAGDDRRGRRGRGRGADDGVGHA